MKWKTVGVFVAAFALRFSLVLARHDYLTPLPDETVKVARSIVETGVFGNPWMVPTGPTGALAPIEPYLIGLSYRLFGEGPRGELARHVVGCAASSLVYAALMPASVALGLGETVGFAAGVAGALLPLKYHTEVSGAWEAPWAASALILLIVRAYSRIKRGVTTGGILLDGLLWGLALLINPAMLPVLLGLLVLEAFRGGASGLPRYLARAGLQLAVVALVLTPWTVRNYTVLHAFCPVRCSFGLEFFTGNNPRAAVLQNDNFGAGSLHPSVNPAECRLIVEKGEIEYNHEKFQAAVDWVKTAPARFAGLTVAHFLLFWFEWTPSALPVTFANWAITAAGIAGMVLLLRRRHPVAPLILCVWITFPLVYYVIQASTKYRFPIDWTFLLLGGFAFQTLFSRASPNSPPRPASGFLPLR